MNIVHSDENFPSMISKTIFLAGPSPRDASHPDWREEAIEILKNLNYDGHVYIPLPKSGIVSDYEDQIKWEQSAMDRADVILFWIPRDLEKLPGFTTNVEFGQRIACRNVVVGFPKDSPKNRYLESLALSNHKDVHYSLGKTIAAAIKMLKSGAGRVGTYCEIPLYIWENVTFKSWLSKQINAGNRLDGFKPKFTFGVGPKEGFLLYWGGVANIYVQSEDRNKSNELVIGRPDIKHTMGIYRGDSLSNSYVIMVKEFRSPSMTADGFIREIPGGSGFKPEKEPRETAAKEFAEETGMAVEPARLKYLSSRQLAGTTSVHQAHLFVFDLTLEELNEFRRKEEAGEAYGVVKETERTYVEVHSIKDLILKELTDWTNLGMILSSYHLG